MSVTPPAAPASIPASDPFAEALAGATTPTDYLEAAHRAVIHAATFAPSVHNSQPWLFTHDAGGLDLYADDVRRLRVLDGEGRLVRISCGAALQHAEVAARALGFLARSRLLPDPVDPGHLARLDLTAGAPGSPQDRRLASAILLRHTHRDAFEERALPADLMTDLRAAAELHGAVLVELTGDDLIELEVLLAWADGVEEADPAYRAEVASSLRTAPAEDGIAVALLPADPERGSSLRLRDFAHADRPPRDSQPPVAEKPTVVLVVTDHDSPRDWLQGGRALSSVLLHAAAVGVMGQPLAQATDFPAARARLRSALGLVGVPQMALRLGHAPAGGAAPRRDVDDVLREVPGADGPHPQS